MNSTSHPFTHRLTAYRSFVFLLAALLLLACQPIQPPTVTPAEAAETSESEIALVGTWTVTVTKEDLVRVRPEFPSEFLCDNAGTFVWQFNADGSWIIDQTGLEECPPPGETHFENTWVNDGNLVTLAEGTPDEEVYEWSVEGDLLTFVLRAGECPPCEAINTANPWQRVNE